jgi:elongation factor Ts
MAEITAAMVRDLRERSGLPMMDCKQALVETGGDVKAAMELLRKRGAAAAQKKAGRTTAEGRVGKYRDDNVSAMVELQCETAPVANNPLFRELADNIAKQAALSGQVDPEAILSQKLVGDKNATVTTLMHDAVNMLRENMKIARIVRETGRTGAYVHHNGKIGVLIGVDGTGGDDTLLSEICMHITFAQPQAVTRDQVPAELVNSEIEVAKELVLKSGKPANLVDKIVAGKMDRWFSERVLTEQAFVKDEKKTVGQVLKEAGITIRSVHRLQVGEVTEA